MQATKNAPASSPRPGADHGGIGSLASQGYKQCVKCGETKSLGDYHRDRSKSDGRNARCKVCRNKEAADYRTADPEKAREIIRRWRSRNYELSLELARQWKAENPELVATQAKEWRRENPEAVVAARERYAQRYPEKIRANRAVANAVRRGTLAKPSACEDCGETTPKRLLHGHHEDYEKKLEVDWLCPACHTARHKEHPEGLKRPKNEPPDIAA